MGIAFFGDGAHGRRRLFVRRINRASLCDAILFSAILLGIWAVNEFACGE
jgi:hypothetical protein